jgi:hypothetical protein
MAYRQEIFGDADKRLVVHIREEAPKGIIVQYPLAVTQIRKIPLPVAAPEGLVLPTAEEVQKYGGVSPTDEETLGLPIDAADYADLADFAARGAEKVVATVRLLGGAVAVGWNMNSSGTEIIASQEEQLVLQAMYHSAGATLGNTNDATPAPGDPYPNTGMYL